MISLLYIGIAHSLFTILFFMTNHPNRISDKVVSVFMMMLVIPVIGITLTMSIGGPGIGIPPYMRLTSFPFTYGPLIYFYARAVTSETLVIKKKDLLHFLPFILFTAVSLVFTREINTPHPPPGLRASGPVPAESVFMHFQNIAILVSFIYYSVLIITLVNSHKKRLKDYFTAEMRNMTLHWLLWIIISFILTYLFIIISEFVIDTGPNRDIMPPHHIHAIGLTFFIIVFSFFALKQPTIYRYQMELSSGGVDKERKYEESGLKDDEAGRYLSILESYMNDKKPYTDGDLTIVDIAAVLEIPRHHITRVINERLNKNFYTYVNEYRIKLAKEMMSDESFRDNSLLSIAYEAGFNSKSSFKTVFKKFTGMTPSEYRLNA